MAPIIRDVLIHAVVGENLSVQRDCCGEQELEMVLGGDVAVFHAIPLHMGMVGSGELGSCMVHHIKEGVDRLTSDVGVFFFFFLSLIYLIPSTQVIYTQRLPMNTILPVHARIPGDTCLNPQPLALRFAELINTGTKLDCHNKSRQAPFTPWKEKAGAVRCYSGNRTQAVEPRRRQRWVNGQRGRGEIEGDRATQWPINGPKGM